MTIKGILAIVTSSILIALIALVAYLLGIVSVGLDNVASLLVASLILFLLLALLSLAAVIFKPFRDRLEGFVQENIKLVSQTQQCRILVYGLPRSGKTTIIKRVLTEQMPRPEESTKAFDFYKETLRLRLEDPKKYTVAIADYTGQKPSQVKVNPPEKFFGPIGQRLINVIFFVVDLFPEIRDAQGEPLKNQEIIKQYGSNASQQINNRVEKNLKYVNGWDIEEIFSAAYSERLFAVRLLVNKADLLRGVVSRGYIPEVNEDSMYQFVMNLYAPVNEELRAACRENGIDDFSVHLISAETGENIPKMWGEILEKYAEEEK